MVIPSSVLLTFIRLLRRLFKVLYFCQVMFVWSVRVRLRKINYLREYIILNTQLPYKDYIFQKKGRGTKFLGQDYNLTKLCDHPSLLIKSLLSGVSSSPMTRQKTPCLVRHRTDRRKGPGPRVR